MTKITIKKYEVTAEGHAKAQRINDNDLVCCAISTLLGTLGNALLDMYYDNLLCTPPKIKQKSGYMHIKAEPKKKYEDMTIRVIRSFTIGLEVLAEQYPKNIIIDNSEG
ncbi:MAG: ribosomal-processing cysteine protease Prp [Eubacterium coprostanoligenes]|uniref:ribosomal-processing cysteine protease Prp n=1 Tax=Eubacterium coprostanoligenes TaxID=290054 RepID=UPI0023F18388|nr:ribosomal-processing cysteine protease Prp [Eubacterium coprostanoligenes]MDD7358074.1 ribosomal-processing cysteine protease Prp [Eubacterium coprostanoligenes]